jgi:hypothetical protein
VSKNIEEHISVASVEGLVRLASFLNINTHKNREQLVKEILDSVGTSNKNSWPPPKYE